MNKNRVVWHEGLFLRPQHLQQQERFLQHWIEGCCNQMPAFNWGLVQLEIDEQLLTLGKVSIRLARGIFSDGTPFNIPTDSPSPTPLQLSSEIKDEILYLALPLTQPNAALISGHTNKTQKNSLSRYNKRDLVVSDLHSEKIESEADLQVGELNITVKSGKEKLDAYTVIPIARVIDINKDGIIRLDKEYILTAMHCTAANQLKNFISEVQGLLTHNGKTISKRLITPDFGEVSGSYDLLLLQIINRIEPLFHHFHANPAFHPEELFKNLVSLAGELTTFTPEHRPPKFPDYIHTNQQVSFEPVMNTIRYALANQQDPKAVGIDIHERKPGIWIAVLKNKSILNAPKFILAAKANIPRETVRNNLPNQITIASVEKITDLIRAQIPGVEIEPVDSPRQIPIHAGFTYFGINTQNKYWKQLENSSGLAIHLGAKLESLEMELWAIQE